MGFIDRTGEENINNKGLKMRIISYKGCDDIDVEFEDGYIAYNTRYDYFLKGHLRSKYFKSVYDIGYIGYANTTKNGRILPSYKTWNHMLERCSGKIQEKRPTYKDVSCCEEWLCYANFKKWYDDNYYEIDGKRMNLDKDILVKGNKIYSPETCIFVPTKINSLFIKSDKARGTLPIGVYTKNNKTYGVVSINNQYLGRGFNTPEEAFYAYKNAKEKYIKQVAEEYKDKIPEKLYDAMRKWEVEITD